MKKRVATMTRRSFITKVGPVIVGLPVILQVTSCGGGGSDTGAGSVDPAAAPPPTEPAATPPPADPAAAPPPADPAPPPPPPPATSTSFTGR